MKKINGIETQCIVALIKAEKLLGSGTNLAKAVGIRKQKLNYLKQNGKIPYAIAVQISSATKGKVSIKELCPQSEFLTKQINDAFRESVKKTEEKIIKYVQSCFRAFYLD